LELSISITEVDDSKLERASELTLRTSQFNMSTRAKTTAEVSAFIAADNKAAFTVHVSDRFGDYGTVGLLLLETGSAAVSVETFLLSCRVLGRGVEHEVAAFIGNYALEKSVPDVSIDYQKTGRNAPATSFLQQLPCSDSGAGNAVACHVGKSADFSQVIYSAPELVSADSTGSPDVRDSNLSPAYSQYASMAEHISTNLISASAILAQVVGSRKKGVRPDLMTQYEPPASVEEKKLADVWMGILNLDRVGLEDNFFQLGGTSLKAVEMVASVRSQGLTQLSIVKVFENPTIKGILGVDDVAAEQSVNVRKRTKNKRRRAES